MLLGFQIKWFNPNKFKNKKYFKESECCSDGSFKNYGSFATPRSYRSISTLSPSGLKIGEFQYLKFLENNVFLNRSLIERNLNNFWANVMNHLNENQYVLLQMIIKYTDNRYVTLGYMQKINKNDFEKLLKSLYNTLDIKAEDYRHTEVGDTLFKYFIVPEDKITNKKSAINKNINTIKYPNFNFMGYQLPNTANFHTWGQTYLNIDNTFWITKPNSNMVYKIETSLYFNIVTLMDKETEEIILEFKDNFDSRSNLNSFTRTIKDQSYVFKDSKLIVKKLNRKTKFLNVKELSKEINNKFITLDIETRVIKNEIKPILIAFYDGLELFNFYLDDFKSEKDMINTCLSKLLKPKYNNYRVYVHNLSHFDGIFLLKYLSSLENATLKPVLKDGKMIELKLGFGRYKIIFRDSYLLLPLSLRKLAKAFKVDDKSIFPYAFLINTDTSLNYKGSVPEFKYFKDITIEEYNKYVEKYSLIGWNLKDELIKYCNQDNLSLYQVVDQFNYYIFDLFSLNINDFPTLPSLTFGIFRAHYLKDNKIPLIIGNTYHDIRSGYTGGSTDVYIPRGENIKAYDVNSLYPFAMKNCPMPVGNITFFEGDITKLDPNAFGFFYVKVTSPEYLEHPILQTKVKTPNGFRTVAPLGTWYDYIFSEEMYNAMKYGYNFEIIKGYLFDKEYIFTEFVNKLYLIKQNHTKDHPMYLISKLLMNSLYGKFGMMELLAKHAVMDTNEFYDFINNDNNIIRDSLDFNNNFLISYLDKNKIEKNIINSDNASMNISIAIAAAVTAYSRIEMSKFKNNPNFNLYYTDTDSIYIDKDLNTEFVSNNELGKLKLEYTFQEFVAIAPKVYGGLFLTNNNQIKELVKVKGFKNKVSFSELKSLLIKDNTLTLQHEKWYKNIENSNIEISNEIYRLIATGNKRQLVYKEGLLIGTKPFIIDENKIIK